MSLALKSLQSVNKMREFEENAKYQAETSSITKWNSQLPQKDLLARKKLLNTTMKESARLSSESIKANRRERLERLFREEELQYESELEALGLTFRRGVP